MKRRIFWYMTLVSILAVILSIIATISIYYKSILNQTKQDVKTISKYAQTIVTSNGIDGLSKTADKKNRITILSIDGEVLFDNFGDSLTMENHSDRPEIIEALNNGHGESTRYSKTSSKQTYYFAKKINETTILRVSKETNSIISTIGDIAPIILFVAIAVILLELLIVGFLTKKIVNPINNIQLDYPAYDLEYNELSPLVARINKQNEIIKTQLRDLKQSQQEFSAITENMSEGFVIVDGNKNILSYNKSALNIFGISKEIDNQNVLTLNRSPDFRTSVEQAIHGFKSQKIVKINDRSYDIIANPVYKLGKIKGAVIVVLDVTEKEQREHLRREFAANVSHELKTPLTSISGFAEIMKNGLVKPEDTIRFSEKIYDEAARLITLVQDIIKLSQLDENGATLEKTSVDIFALTQSIWQRLEPIAQKRNISFDLKGQPTTVTANNQILSEMIYNLIDNAIKYNIQNGSINISIISADSTVNFTITDSGIGIPNNDQQRVFERFYRVDKSHSKTIGGTGLGLSIVKNGAALHQAKLSLNSEVNKGTTITVIFNK